MDLNREQKAMLFRFSAYGFLKNLRFFELLILLFFTVARGLSYTQFGILVAVREVSVYLLEIPTGIVADVTGRRRTMMACFVSYLISFAIFTWGDSFWAFVPGMVLFAAGEALRSGTHKSMIMQHLDLEDLSHLKVDYYGYTRAASRLGSAVAALAVGVFGYFGGGYGMIFPATMVPYTLALFLMMTYPPELDGTTHRSGVVRQMLRHTVDSFKSIWRVEQLGRMVANESVFDAAFRVAKDYLQPIVRTAALALPVFLAARSDERRVFLVIGITYFVIYMNSFFSSRLSGRVAGSLERPARTLNGLFWAFAAVFCLAGALYRMELAWPAILVLFFMYTLYNLRKPMVVGFLSDRIPGQQRATVLSVQSQLRAIFAAVMAPLFGWVADNPKLGVPWAFLLGGAALFVLGLLLRLRRGSEAVEPVSSEKAR